MWDEITYPFSNFMRCTVEVLEWISNFVMHFIMCNYMSMLELKLFCVSKKSPSNQEGITCVTTVRRMEFVKSNQRCSSAAYN